MPPHTAVVFLLAALACDRDPEPAPTAPTAPPAAPMPVPSLPEVPDLARTAAQIDKFQLFSFDLAPFGSARSTWTIRSGDTVHFSETRERGRDGTLHIAANERDVYIREGALYTVHRGTCEALAGAAIEPMLSGLGMAPAGGLAAMALGVVIDGVPRETARLAATEADGTERWEFDWTIAEGVAERRIRGEVWLDGEGRVVRSRGTSDGRTLTQEIPQATWEHAVTRAGEDIDVSVPASCPALAGDTGLGAVPRMQNAQVTMQMGRVLSYQVSGDPDAAVAWHERELAAAGYALGRKQAQGRSTLLLFRKDGEELIVTISADQPGQVIVMLAQQ